MSGSNGKTVSIKVKIAVTPEFQHDEVLAMIERFNLRETLEYLMATQHNKTMVRGIQDAEGKQLAELVVSLENRAECRGGNARTVRTRLPQPAQQAMSG